MTLKIVQFLLALVNLTTHFKCETLALPMVAIYSATQKYFRFNPIKRTSNTKKANISVYISYIKRNGKWKGAKCHMVPSDGVDDKGRK
jgi:hypothetical protein